MRNIMATPALSPDRRQASRTDGLYARDFYSWSMRQAEALKRRDFASVDLQNLIEEIEDLGSEKKNAWESCCARSIEHLLKIEYCRGAADEDLKHWAREVLNFRKQMARLIDKNPGLKGQYAEMFAEAWRYGREDAVDRLAEYDEDRKRGVAGKQAARRWDRDLPGECPYRFEHVTAYDPESDRSPRQDIWPPSAATILNARLGREYPLLADYAPLRG